MQLPESIQQLLVAKACLERRTHFLHVSCSEWVSEVIRQATSRCQMANASGGEPTRSCTLHGLRLNRCSQSLSLAWTREEFRSPRAELPGSVTASTAMGTERPRHRGLYISSFACLLLPVHSRGCKVSFLLNTVWLIASMKHHLPRGPLPCGQYRHSA